LETISKVTEGKGIRALTDKEKMYKESGS